MRFQQYINESINDKGILKAVVLGGLPAAGKTTVVKTIINDGAYPIKVLNTDKWTEKFKGDYVNNKGKIKKLSNDEFYSTINSLLPMYIDTVSGNLSIFKRRINELRNVGYDVKMVFVDIDYETSLQRLIKRNKKQKRQVDLPHLKREFDKFYAEGKYKEIESTPLYKQFSAVIGEKPIIVRAKDTSWNKLNKKVYNEVIKYLDGPIKNEKGKKLIDYMKKNGYKYYNDIPEEWLLGNGYPRLKDIIYY